MNDPACFKAVCQANGLDPATIATLLELLVQAGGILGPYLKDLLVNFIHNHLPQPK
jgi:hypothetical protein